MDKASGKGVSFGFTGTSKRFQAPVLKHDLVPEEKESLVQSVKITEIVDSKIVTLVWSRPTMVPPRLTGFLVKRKRLCRKSFL